MKKPLLALLFLASLWAIPASAQSSVSVNLGSGYANGSLTTELLPPQNGNVAVTHTFLDGNGQTTILTLLPGRTYGFWATKTDGSFILYGRVTVTGAPQDITSALLTVGSGGGGGGSPAGPPGTVQITNLTSSGFAASSILDNGTTVAVNENTQFKGPNPYTDVTVAHVISTATPTSTPWVPGIAGTIGASSAALTVSAASTLQNGMGIDVWGAGATCPVSAPVGMTVTPSIAAGPTGTGITVPAPAGSTAYAYEAIARDQPGCYTAASSPATTSIGTSSLGAQSLAITGFTQATNVVTATVSSTAGLATGAYVFIYATASNSDGTYFGGWYNITVTSGTTFTYQTPNTVTGGAPTVSTGGATMYFWYLNHVTWTLNATPYQYYVYGRTSGAYALIGQTIPNNSSPYLAFNYLDDYGPTMMAGQNFPFFVPTTPPGSSLNDPLITTIVSGGGTTTLTLANAATTSVAGQTVLADNGPPLATLAAASPNQLLYFPAGTYVINSHTNLPNYTFMELAGAVLYQNETLNFASGERIYGMIGPQAIDGSQFGFPTGGTILAVHAYPGAMDTTSGPAFIEGIRFSYAANGGMAFYASGGGTQGHFKNDAFSTTASGDYMGIGLFMTGGFWYDFDHITFNTGPGGVGGGFIGTTATPAVWMNVGDLTFKDLTVQNRGIFLDSRGGASLGQIKFNGLSHDQGGITPFSTLYYNAGCEGGFIQLDSVEMDTTPMAIFDNAASCFLGSVNFPNLNLFVPTNGFGSVTGYPVLGGVIGSSSGQNNGSVNMAAPMSQGVNFTNNSVQINANGEFMYPIATPAGPGLVASVGGLVPTGTNVYAVTVLDANGNESTLGTSSSIVISGGTQTVTITPPTAPAGATQWRPYRNGQLLAGVSGISFSATYVDSLAFAFGGNPPGVNRAGAESISSVGLVGTALVLAGGGFKSTDSGIFTANRTVTTPDASGTKAFFSGALTIGDCPKIAAGPTLVDSLGTCSGSTWPSLAGGTNTTSAFVVGTGSSINPSGAGVITATAVPFGGVTGTIALGQTQLTTNGDLLTVAGGILARLAQGANGTFLGVSGGALGYFTPTGTGTVTHTAGNLTANCVVVGNGLADITVIPCDTTVTHALFATGGAPAFRALAGTDLPLINLALSSPGGVTGNLPVTNLGSGTGAGSTTFWRGDGTWATPTGSGTVNNAQQFSFPYYSGAGSTNSISGVAAPTGPNGVPEFEVSIPAGGAATAPVVVLPGILTRNITGATSTDTIASTDCNPQVVNYQGSVAVATTLPTATTLAVPSCTLKMVNNTSGSSTAVTVTATTWTFNTSGSSTLVIAQGQECNLTVDTTSATQWDADCHDEPLLPGTNITITRNRYGVVVNSSAGGTPCNTTALSLQYDNAGVFGCVPDFTFSTPHTLLMGASGLLDLSAGAAGSFKIPVAAGCTSASNGSTCYDTTNGNTHLTTNAVDSLAVGEAAAIAVNTIPKATNSTNSLLAASSVVDNGTTVTSTDTGGYVGPVFTANGSTAGFVDYPQGTTSAAVAPCTTGSSICEQAPTAVTSYLVVKPGVAAQGNLTNIVTSAVDTQGFSGDANHSAVVTIGSGTSIGSTQLCSTANCPVGTYRVNVYADITTACGTTGTYVVNLIYTDDQGSKTVVVNMNGTGAVPATGVLTTTSTSNFGQESQVLRSTGGASINYSTTATACGTGGPMVGKLYLSVEPLQ